MPLEIRQVTTDDVRPLRHAILRPGRAFESSSYPSDPGATHLAVVDGEAIVAILSLHDEPVPGDPRPGDVRLRGMAVAADRQGQGMGSALVRHAISRVVGRRLWCNARATARRFYERHGFTVTGEPFDIEGIGEHWVMMRPADTTDRDAEG